MSKRDKLPVKNEVIHQLAVGEPQTSIAEQVGVDQSTISRFANEDEIRQLIEEEREKLVRIVPKAVQNIKDLVEEMPSLAKDDIDNLKLSYAAGKYVLKAANILPSNQYAHNIYNDNRTQTVVDPAVMSLFSTDIDKKMQPVDMNEENLNME